MARVKQYGQFCALARSLDVVGDRWTLLVVRELLLGPASYGALLQRLPGLATNLLADRLRRLQTDGLVAADRGRGDPYVLTERGAALRPVVHELLRWGAPLMERGPGADVVHGHWLPLALAAVLDSDRVTGPKARLRMSCGETAVDVVVTRAGRRVTGAEREPDVELVGELPQLLAAAHSGTVVDGLRLVGDEATATAVLRRA